MTDAQKMSGRRSAILDVCENVPGAGQGPRRPGGRREDAENPWHRVLARAGVQAGGEEQGGPEFGPVFGALSLGEPGPQTGRQLQEEAWTTDVELLLPEASRNGCDTGW